MSSKSKGLAGLVALLIAAAPVWAQQIDTSAQANLEVLRAVPQDVVGVVMVSGLQRGAAAVDDMLVKVAGPMLPAGMGLRSALKGIPLGPDFDPEGSAAAFLLDVREVDPTVAKLFEGGDERPSMETFAARMPLVLVLPVKGVDNLFPGTKVQKAGDELRFVESAPVDGQEPTVYAYGRMIGKHLALSQSEPAIESLSELKPFASALPMRSAAHRTMLVRDHAWFWVDRRKVAALWEAKLLPGMEQLMDLSPMGGAGMFMMMAGAPMVYPIGWAYLTRDAIFDEADTLAGGLSFTGEAIRLEARWSFPGGTQVGKALADWKPSGKPLITQVPADQPAWFLYGGDKSFRTPLDIKKRAWEGMLEMGPLAMVAAEDKKPLLDAVATLQEQVTHVQHFLGETQRGGLGMNFGTVVKCKSSAKVMEQVPKIVEAGKALMQAAPGPVRQEFSFEFQANEAQILGKNVDVLTINMPMPPDAQGKEIFRQVFGAKKLQLSFVAVDEETVVTSLMGGEKFLEKLMAGAMQGGAKLPAAHDEMAKLLPAGRSAEMFIDVDAIVDFWVGLMMQSMPPGMAPPISYDAEHPIAVGVVPEKGMLSIVGLIPYDIPKGYFDTMQRMMGPGGPGGPPPGEDF